MKNIVHIYDPKTEQTHTFNTQKDAAKFVGVGVSSISMALLKRDNGSVDKDELYHGYKIWHNANSERRIWLVMPKENVPVRAVEDRLYGLLYSTFNVTPYEAAVLIRNKFHPRFKDLYFLTYCKDGVNRASRSKSHLLFKECFILNDYSEGKSKDFNISDLLKGTVGSHGIAKPVYISSDGCMAKYCHSDYDAAQYIQETDPKFKHYTTEAVAYQILKRLKNVAPGEPSEPFGMYTFYHITPDAE